MSRFLILLLTVCVIVGCNETKSPQLPASAEEMKTDEIGFENRHQANGYSMTIRSTNKETSTVQLITEGLPVEFTTAFTVEGQVKETLMLDINNDGQKEFYLLISPTDDSGNIDLKAYVVNQNQEVSEAMVMDQQLGMREMNSDAVQNFDGNLVRSFSVAGKESKFQYMLMSSGSDFLLVPQLISK